MTVNTDNSTPDRLDQSRSALTNQAAPHRIRSEELFQGQIEVLISHGTETYRLRRTRNGKLILQK